MIFTAVLSFAGALTARLLHRRWQAWLVWLTLSCVGGVFALASNYPAEAVLTVFFVSSAFGFVSPELWESFRSWIRQPRTAGVIAVIAVLGFLLFNRELAEELIGPILVLAIMLYGFKVMFLGLGGRKRRR